MKKIFYILVISIIYLACGDSEGPMIPVTYPTVSVDNLNVLEGEENKSIFASFRLSKSSEETVTIFVETEDGSAKSGSDYVAISQSIVFEPGEVQENIKLDILGDDESELDESFVLKITDASKAVIGTPSVSIIIQDNDAGSGGVIIPSTGYTTPESYAGMEQIFADEFDGTELNTSWWTFEIGNGDWGWGNNELEYYRKENTTLVDGHLVIEARQEVFNGFNYTSSRLITRDKFEFQYGRVDIRAVMPEGQGLWPALWMLGENISSVGWPRCGEVDIMELVGHEPSTMHSTVHYADSAGNRLLNGTSKSLSGGEKFSEEFHVFSIVWVEDKIEFFLDDVRHHTVSRGSLGLSNPYPFNDPFFFIFNVAVGGQWPGNPDGTTTFPQHMIVDYIRVFQ